MAPMTIAPHIALAARPPLRSAPEPRTWTITASLAAARTETDGAISLMLADPDGRPHRMMVLFPPSHAIQGAACAQLRARLARARDAFVGGIVEPPFEGCALLYGTARLTLTTPGPEASGARRCAPLVVGFDAL